MPYGHATFCSIPSLPCTLSRTVFRRRFHRLLPAQPLPRLPFALSSRFMAMFCRLYIYAWKPTPSLIMALCTIQSTEPHCARRHQRVGFLGHVSAILLHRPKALMQSQTCKFVHLRHGRRHFGLERGPVAPCCACPPRLHAAESSGPQRRQPSLRLVVASGAGRGCWHAAAAGMGELGSSSTAARFVELCQRVRCHSSEAAGPRRSLIGHSLAKAAASKAAAGPLCASETLRYTLQAARPRRGECSCRPQRQVGGQAAGEQRFKL